MSPPSVSAFAAPVSLTSRNGPTVLGATRSPLRAPATPTVASAPRMAFSSIQNTLTAPPVVVTENPNTVIAAIYKQMLGNAHLMESERDEMSTAESTFKLCLDTRQFVREVAYSSAYKSRFFDSVSQFRFIELAFKHILGRAARSLAEYGEAMAAYTNGGYEACINWFVDSAEYEENFGTLIVPYGEYKGCYPTNEEFNRSVAIRGTPCASDKARSSVLQYAVCSGDSPSWLTISKALPFGTERGTGLCVGGHWTSTQRNKNAPVRVGTKVPGGVVFY